eukprot:TRINITY_DN23580_c0_g2_i2.p1 TRINITY_DN23580_c0_g2~~TRINITY_DN23580_c0_g2_i2.p1  ORF type:complete len:297 (-),score=38.64 TRINITY_DN23580_c0_g2_i2:4-894(-)
MDWEGWGGVPGSAAAAAGDPSSLDFQTHGYGGFGYDTSHVEPDEPEPALVGAAKQGELGLITALVEQESAAGLGDRVRIVGLTSDAGQLLNGQEGKVVATANANGRVGVDVGQETAKLLKPTNLEVVECLELRQLLNQSRRWTEVDYKMSGFTKEYEWHDLTPVAAAAMHGHPHVVRYLLLTGIADPTLEGCYSDDEIVSAFKAATVQSYSNNGVKAEDRDQCQKLLAAAEPFWGKAAYSGPQYSAARAKSGFSNSPSNTEDLKAAIEAVGVDSVSYTHLTLPTKRIVEISVGAGT